MRRSGTFLDRLVRRGRARLSVRACDEVLPVVAQSRKELDRVLDEVVRVLQQVADRELEQQVPQVVRHRDLTRCVPLETHPFAVLLSLPPKCLDDPNSNSCKDGDHFALHTYTRTHTHTYHHRDFPSRDNLVRIWGWDCCESHPYWVDLGLSECLTGWVKCHFGRRECVRANAMHRLLLASSLSIAVCPFCANTYVRAQMSRRSLSHRPDHRPLTPIFNTVLYSTLRFSSCQS